MSVTATVLRRHINRDYYNVGGSSYISTASGGGTTIHREMAELTPITAKHLVVTFGKEFAAKPFGKLEVYRYVTQGAGIGKQNVLFTFPDANWLTKTGFTIDIAAFEDLNGIIVFYQYTE